MEEILCFYGCGRPAKYGDVTGKTANDPPRCANMRSECPVVRVAARKAHNSRRLRRLH